ncbi:MAG: excisionase [Acidimicrobiales bacterium]
MRQTGGEAPDGDARGDRWDRLLDDLASQPLEEGWVTLEEAVDASGVSRSTLRSWYRSGRIPSRMVAGVHGPQRVVPLAVVVDQALASPRSLRQLERARSLQAELDALRERVQRLERHLGFG